MTTGLGILFNQFGAQTCLVLPLTNVIIKEIPAHQLQ